VHFNVEESHTLLVSAVEHSVPVSVQAGRNNFVVKINELEQILNKNHTEQSGKYFTIMLNICFKGLPSNLNTYFIMVIMQLMPCLLKSRFKVIIYFKKFTIRV